MAASIYLPRYIEEPDSGSWKWLEIILNTLSYEEMNSNESDRELGSMEDNNDELIRASAFAYRIKTMPWRRDVIDSK